MGSEQAGEREFARPARARHAALRSRPSQRGASESHDQSTSRSRRPADQEQTRRARCLQRQRDDDGSDQIEDSRAGRSQPQQPTVVGAPAGAAPATAGVSIPGPAVGLVRRVSPRGLLQGAAFDDANRPLTGPRLRWYTGSRLLGRGERVTAIGLTPHTRAIRLVATDTHGRSAQAVLRLRVTVAAARYLVFQAPLAVSRRARSVRIRVASSTPATFIVAGRRYAVGPRPRTLTIPIRPGRSLLRLACALRSTGGVIRGTYIAVQ